MLDADPEADAGSAPPPSEITTNLIQVTNIEHFLRFTDFLTIGEISNKFFFLAYLLC